MRGVFPNTAQRRTALLSESTSLTHSVKHVTLIWRKSKKKNKCNSSQNQQCVSPPTVVVVVVVSELKRKQHWGPGRGKYRPRHSLLAYLHLYLPGSVVSAGSFPLLSSGERWLSAGERRQRLCTVSIVWRDTWRTWETRCRCREEEWEGTHLRGLIFFIYLFFSFLTELRLVSFFEGAF